MNNLTLDALRSVSPAWKALQARKMDRLRRHNLLEEQLRHMARIAARRADEDSP